jgi:AcrR family transcriptional regulator
MDDFERLPSFSRRQWQLLDAALRLLDREGISGFTMRSLAQETGLSPMAAYKHFENQRAMQLELWRSCQNHLYDTLLEATEAHTDPAMAFLALCEAFMRYAVRYPFRFELLYNHPFAREVSQFEGLDELRMAVWDYAHELLQRAQAAGTFRTDVSSELLLAAAGAQARGVAARIFYSEGGPTNNLSPDTLIASAVSFVRDALLPR